MADTTLDDILAETTAESTADASIAALLTGIKAQLDQALSGATLSPAQQAKVNAIFANMKANAQVIADATLANTPASPTPPADGGSTSSSITVSSSQNPATPGAPVTLTGAVTGDGKDAVTGSVEFMDGSASLGSANVDSTGVAAFSVSTLTVGDHPITAVYSGDGIYATSTSGVLTQTIATAVGVSGTATSDPAPIVPTPAPAPAPTPGGPAA